jgi:thioredoxin-related protein
MKTFLLLFTFVLTLFGAEIDEFATNMGYFRDYKQAISVAKKENKPLMLVMVGDYCPWCRKFERKTLQQEVIAMSVNKDFIALIVDRNLDKEHYPKELYANRIPTVYFIDPKKGSTFFESLGYVKKDEFQETLADAMKEYTGANK